jgi:hypothetical protein
LGGVDSQTRRELGDLIGLLKWEAFHPLILANIHEIFEVTIEDRNQKKP